MPRKTPGDGAPVPPPKPPKKRKRAASGVAKATRESAKRTRKAERAIRAGKGPPVSTLAEEVALAQRRIEALRYAEAGHDAATIGEWLDPPCTGRQAQALINAALDEIRTEVSQGVERVRTMQLRRLDAMLAKPLENAIKGDVQSGALVLKIMERQAALVGADAPQRQEHTGRDGQPIEKSVTIRRVVVPVEPIPDA